MNLIQKLQTAMNSQTGRSQTNMLNSFLSEKPYAIKAGNSPTHGNLLKYIDLKQGKEVLELGCGPGKYVALLSTAGFNVTGTDPYFFPTWEDIREKSSAKLIDKVFAESLPFEDETFDHIACMGALLYFENPAKAFAEIYRVLKPGGTLLVKSVNSVNLYTSYTGKRLDPASKQLYNLSELEALIKENSFTLIDSFAHGFWPPVLTNFWWYLSCVWVGDGFANFLSNILNPRNRVNNIVAAKKATLSDA